jgi:2-polyprenyl-3-methyl-5-hydroxy-6-metoxy-1,4-benzoquinol methylase
MIETLSLQPRAQELREPRAYTLPIRPQQGVASQEPVTQLLDSERAFFDREALGLSEAELRIPTPAQVERYRTATSSTFNEPKDTLFSLLMPLAGKRVCDYGCGHGEDACLLAACGAQVTAFDLSPASIAQARRRAQMHGLEDRVRLDVREAGKTGYAPGSFDLVTGFAILHHLHQCLPAIYEEIDALLAPHGAAYFIEPVANSAVLRALRRLIPVKTEATPDERQLTYRDFEPLRRYFSDVQMYHFHGLERLNRLLGRNGTSVFRWLDSQAQRLFPVLRPYYGIVLVVARR